jgi:hypothetical protein
MVVALAPDVMVGHPAQFVIDQRRQTVERVPVS